MTKINRRHALHLLRQYQTSYVNIDELPHGCNWYVVSGLQTYPRNCAFSYLQAAEDGLCGVVAKRITHGWRG